MEEGREAVHVKLGGGRSRQKREQQGRHGKNLRRQQWTGSNGNLWSQPYVPPGHDEDYIYIYSHRRLIFCKERLPLNSAHSRYITSYPTHSSLELLLFQYRPPVMVLHNCLQSHCHLNRCRCNCTSHHDQYRCYVKYMQQEQFY